ncbi:MAG TPA: hypothetical protein PLC65_06565, partial [Bacteroidia bacterium]|nr:hypothetical protein [Bacteroidia bacterium]
MKTIKFFIVALFLGLAAINFTSCKGSDEKEPNPLADSLSGLNSELNGKLSEKEAAIQQFVTT